MKRFFALFSGFLLCACSENTCLETPTSPQPEQIQILEEAFPNHAKELITLPNGMQVEKLDSIYILGGDILLTQGQIDQIVNTRSAYNDIKSRRWPMGIVFYEIADSAIPIKSRIESAMTHIETNTNIRFYEKTPFSNYINFFCGDGNWSYIGMIGGKQDLSLLQWGSNTGSAIHEICHSLGFFHEQSRVDRDNYITINWDNIQEDKKYNFKTYSQNGYSNGIDIGTLDFNSIMLYPSYNSFAIDTTIPTMTKKDGSTFIGQRNSLSDSDIAAIKSKYGFSGKGDLMWMHAGTKTGNEGFDTTTEYTTIYLIPKKTPTENLKIEIHISYYQTTTMQDSDDERWEDIYTVTIPPGTRYGTLTYRNLWEQQNQYGWKNITGTIESVTPEAFEFFNS